MKWRFVLSLVILLLFSVASSIKSSQARDFSWDLPGYLGVFYSTKTSDISKIHSQTYESLYKTVTPEEKYFLNGLDNPTQPIAVFAKNPQAFYEQIPYYHVKILYNALIFSVAEFGMVQPAKAPYLLNEILFFFFPFLIFVTFLKIFPKDMEINLLLTILISSLSLIRYLVTIPSPDFLALFFLLIFFYYFLRSNGKELHFAYTLILMLIRPDFIVFSSIFLVVFGLMNLKRKSKIKIVFYLLILFSVYWGMLKISNYPGWKDVFYDSFIYRRNFISLEKADFTFQQYLNVLWTHLKNSKKLIAVSSALLILCYFFSAVVWKKLFSAVLFLSIFIRFLIFPLTGDQRLNIGFLLVFLLLSFSVIAEFRRPRILPEVS